MIVFADYERNMLGYSINTNNLCWNEPKIANTFKSYIFRPYLGKKGDSLNQTQNHSHFLQKYEEETTSFQKLFVS